MNGVQSIVIGYGAGQAPLQASDIASIVDAIWSNSVRTLTSFGLPSDQIAALVAAMTQALTDTIANITVNPVVSVLGPHAQPTVSVPQVHPQPLSHVPPVIR